LASIYTWWNILDRLMEKMYLLRNSDGVFNVGAKWMYGYVRRQQMEVYTQQLKNVHPRDRKVRYCEIGVNGGHGTAAMLVSHPDVEVVSFDLGAYKYSKRVYDLLSLAFPGRITFHVGSSYDEKGAAGTVTKFADLVASGQEQPCDIILIDGDHRHLGAYLDIVNARKIAACDNILLFDDLNEASGNALTQAVNEGIVEVTKKFHGDGTNRKVNPCLRWVGTPSCYNSNDTSFINQRCVKCLPHFSFATGKIKAPTTPGC
jgi:hypothetical protein